MGKLLVLVYGGVYSTPSGLGDAPNKIRNKVIFHNSRRGVIQMNMRSSEVGGKNGLSIVKVEKLNSKGEVVSVSFEVYDSGGNLLGTFNTEGEACAFAENYTPTFGFNP